MRRQSCLLPVPCECLFGVVLDIERYPEFVPGYRMARVVRQTTGGLEVEQTVGAGPFVATFNTHAEFEPLRRIDIRSLDGPLHPLQVEWEFASEGEACRVAFGVDYTLGGSSAPLLAPWLASSAPRLLDCFMRRATQLFGAG